MALHDEQELDDDFGAGLDEHLPLAPLLRIVHVLQRIVQHADAHHPACGLGPGLTTIRPAGGTRSPRRLASVPSRRSRCRKLCAPAPLSAQTREVPRTPARDSGAGEGRGGAVDHHLAIA